MLMLESWREEDWFKAWHEKLFRALSSELAEDDCRGLSMQQLCGWHPTRIFEYPWVLNTGLVQGAVLDIGSNLQFDVALLGLGVSPLTIHATIQDLPGLGTVFPWRENHRGGIQPLRCFERHRDLTMLYGYMDHLKFVQSNYFDTVMCLSVIEHLPADEVPVLMHNMQRVLKPGGNLIMTCDWLTDFPVGEGWPPLITNHDLGKYVPASIEKDFEVPWGYGFDPLRWVDKDIVKSTWEGMRLGVYGFHFQKV